MSYQVSVATETTVPRSSDVCGKGEKTEILEDIEDAGKGGSQFKDLAKQNEMPSRAKRRPFEC